jgi:phage terminase large subunit GpA-like protein
VVVWAIGRGEDMWVVDHAVLHGNPADEREWEEKLDAYLLRPLQHASGQELKIEAAAIDAMGHFTHQAYSFARTRERRRVFVVRGDPQPSKMVKGKATIQDVNWRGKVLKRGVRLWYVGTDTAKDLIFGRLMVTQPGPGYVHFSKELPAAFYEQLTAEARMPVRTARGLEYKWVNPKRRRNEALDCTVYALFCTHMLELHTYTDRMWARLEQSLEPDLFAGPPDDTGTPPAAAVSVSVQKPAPPAGKSFIQAALAARKKRPQEHGL